eukprot:347873-Chlamydomonas_euryale.AAC.1
MLKALYTEQQQRPRERVPLLPAPTSECARVKLGYSLSCQQWRWPSLLGGNKTNQNGFKSPTGPVQGVRPRTRADPKSGCNRVAVNRPLACQVSACYTGTICPPEVWVWPAQHPQ